MKTLSGISWPWPLVSVNQYLTQSSWSWVNLIKSLQLFVILQIKLWESHWLFRRVNGVIHTAAAVYMARVMSRKLDCDVMKTHYSWRHSKFFPYNFQISGLFLSSQIIKLKSDSPIWHLDDIHSDNPSSSSSNASCSLTSVNICTESV